MGVKHRFEKEKKIYLKNFNVPSSLKLLKSKELIESKPFQIAIRNGVGGGMSNFLARGAGTLPHRSQ